jgi:hypothetical protein
MTDSQKYGFYLPVWRRVQAARGWARKPLDLDEEKFRMWPDPAGPLALKVLLFAKQTALQEDRNVAAEDLRRACTLVATSALDIKAATISSKHLDNKQVNHLVTLFRLLIDPDDLKAVTDWMHPESVQLRGLVETLRKMAPEGTLRAIFHNVYHTKNWEDGNRQQLIWMIRELKGRQKTWHREPVMANDNEPF